MDTKGFISSRAHVVPAVIAAAMLLGASGKWPYDYYRVLRWVTCAAAVFIAHKGWAWKRFWATWLFGFVALLFNPIFPIHFSRDLWQVIDVATAGLFVAGIVTLAKPPVGGHTNNGEQDGHRPSDE